MKEEQEYLDKQAPKPAEAKKRPSSAMPNSKGPIKPEDKLKPEDRNKIDDIVNKDKNVLVTIMTVVHEACFMRYQAYE
jgi:hypothetical protein